MALSASPSVTIILACSWALPNGTLMSSSKVRTLSAKHTSFTNSGSDCWDCSSPDNNLIRSFPTKFCLLASCLTHSKRISRTTNSRSSWSSLKSERYWMNRVLPSSSRRSGCPLTSAHRACSTAFVMWRSAENFFSSFIKVGYAWWPPARHRWDRSMLHSSRTVSRPERTVAVSGVSSTDKFWRAAITGWTVESSPLYRLASLIIFARFTPCNNNMNHE